MLVGVFLRQAPWPGLSGREGDCVATLALPSGGGGGGGGYPWMALFLSLLVCHDCGFFSPNL